MNRVIKKAALWIAIVAVLVVVVPIAVFVADLWYHGELGEEIDYLLREPEGLEYVDLGGDFLIIHWPTGSMDAWVTDEAHADPLYGIVPAYIIGDEEEGGITVQILYTTLDALVNSELCENEDFMSALDLNSGSSTDERYTSFTSDIVDPTCCVGIDNELGAAVIIFLGEGQRCEKNAKFYLDDTVIVARDFFELDD